MKSENSSSDVSAVSLADFVAGIAALILGLLLQDAVFFQNTRGWAPTDAVTEEVTMKGESWLDDGGERHQSWREGTYLYKVGESIFRGYRIELAPLMESRKAPRNYVPKGSELPGSSISVWVDPSGLHGSYLREGDTKWLKIAYYTCWIAGFALILSLLMTLRTGLKSFAGSVIVMGIILAGSYAFSYNGDRILEPDERINDVQRYDLLSRIGQLGYRAPKPTELKALKVGMTIDEAAAQVGRPLYFNINSQRLWWGYDGTLRPAPPAVVFENKDGEYRLTSVSI